MEGPSLFSGFKEQKGFYNQMSSEHLSLSLLTADQYLPWICERCCSFPWKDQAGCSQMLHSSGCQQIMLVMDNLHM